MNELLKMIQTAEWPALLKAGFTELEKSAAVFKADAGAAVATALISRGVEGLLREHLVAVQHVAEIGPQIAGLMKVAVECDQQLAEMRKDLDECMTPQVVPIVKMAGADRHSPAGELSEKDTSALRSVAAKTESVADRRIIENAANLMDMKRTLAARDGK